MLNTKFEEGFSKPELFQTIFLPILFTILTLVLNIQVYFTDRDFNDVLSWIQMIVLPVFLVNMVFTLIYLARFVKTKNWKPLVQFVLALINCLIIVVFYAVKGKGLLL